MEIECIYQEIQNVQLINSIYRNQNNSKLRNDYCSTND